MFRILAAAGLALCASVPALAQQPLATISEVDVSVKFDAVDANALDHWPEIGQDLTSAILAAAAPQIDDSGLSVAIVLTEVSLGGAPTLADDGTFNHLAGWVYVRDDPGAPPIKSTQIILDATAFVPGVVPGGEAVIYTIPGRPEYYNALVNVFAYRVLEEVDTAE
jgi:hypothetical protein